MNEFLPYILKSTLCISLFYLAFQILMRKEAFFALNRILLLSIIVCSTSIPLIYLPQLSAPVTQIQLKPTFTQTENQVQELPIVNDSRVAATSQAPITEPSIIKDGFPWIKLIQYIYVAGMLFSVLILIHGILSVLLLFRKARCIRMKGFRLFVVDREIPAFSFGPFVFISSGDYENHREAILVHEQAHIRLLHFFDLMLFETAKIVHWFNPAVYALIGDLKAIHEFQADEHTLNKGIDATQYQLLIIQKGVGSQRFALANSFNHCQIKKRITMMNKSKNSKAWRWKVATFLPLLALLLMAFGKQGENAQSLVKQWTESDFGNPSEIIDTSKSGVNFVTNIYIDSQSQFRLYEKKATPDEISNEVRKLIDYSLADDGARTKFKKVSINGHSRMIQGVIMDIRRNRKTPMEDYQKLLNLVGKVVMETRQKYSKELFNDNYEKLSSVQQDEIKRLIPAFAFFNTMPDHYYPI